MAEGRWEPGDFLYAYPSNVQSTMAGTKADHPEDCECERGGPVLWRSPMTWSPGDVQVPCEWCGEDHGAECPIQARDGDYHLLVPFAEYA